jgi:hypothetical protein
MVPWECPIKTSDIEIMKYSIFIPMRENGEVSTDVRYFVKSSCGHNIGIHSRKIMSSYPKVLIKRKSPSPQSVPNWSHEKSQNSFSLVLNWEMVTKKGDCRPNENLQVFL